MNNEVFTRGIFTELLEITSDFNFYGSKREPEGATPEERHRQRVHALVHMARKMALKRFRQMPEAFRAVHSEDDWIQEAMIILITESLKYRPKDGYYYDKYISERISWRLTDFRRSVCKRNSSPENGRTAQKDAIIDLNELDKGQPYGMSSSPEAICLRKEFCLIIMDCLSDMQEIDRYIVIKHYFYGLSYFEIAGKVQETAEACRSRCRRAVGHLRDWILSRYEFRAQLKGIDNE